jgi:hypothetical protein
LKGINKKFVLSDRIYSKSYFCSGYFRSVISFFFVFVSSDVQGAGALGSGAGEPQAATEVLEVGAGW